MQIPKSKRIFVARIPSTVSEDALRQHFAAYGVVEDAYRPRDFAKNTFRGIGFVTFADPTAVDRVMAMKHTLGGAEVVVDRATPKETNPNKHDSSGESPRPLSAAERMTPSPFPTVEALANNYAVGGPLSAMNDPTFDASFFDGLSRPVAYPSSNGNNRGPPSTLSDDVSGDAAPMPNLGAELYDNTTTTAASMHGVRSSMGVKPNTGASETTAKLTKSPSPKKDKNQRVTDNLAHVRKVRGGPRIFVGKLSKDSVEQDLADYFSQFGFVMDVYIPRSRENKKEHRGFGFVTFETEAAIKVTSMSPISNIHLKNMCVQRAISHGTHILKGANLAIDVAVPESTSSQT